MYYIENSSMYVRIVRVRYRTTEYIKAHVQYFSRPGKTLLSEERNLKIPTTCLKFWKYTKE